MELQQTNELLTQLINSLNTNIDRQTNEKNQRSPLQQPFQTQDQKLAQLFTERKNNELLIGKLQQDYYQASKRIDSMQISNHSGEVESQINKIKSEIRSLQNVRGRPMQQNLIKDTDRIQNVSRSPISEYIILFYSLLFIESSVVNEIKDVISKNLQLQKNIDQIQEFSDKMIIYNQKITQTLLQKEEEGRANNIFIDPQIRQRHFNVQKNIEQVMKNRKLMEEQSIEIIKTFTQDIQKSKFHQNTVEAVINKVDQENLLIQNKISRSQQGQVQMSAKPLQIESPIKVKSLTKSYIIRSEPKGPESNKVSLTISNKVKQNQTRSISVIEKNMLTNSVQISQTKVIVLNKHQTNNTSKRQGVEYSVFLDNAKIQKILLLKQHLSNDKYYNSKNLIQQILNNTIGISYHSHLNESKKSIQQMDYKIGLNQAKTYTEFMKGIKDLKIGKTFNSIQDRGYYIMENQQNANIVYALNLGESLKFRINQNSVVIVSLGQKYTQYLKGQKLSTYRNQINFENLEYYKTKKVSLVQYNKILGVNILQMGIQNQQLETQQLKTIQSSQYQQFLEKEKVKKAKIPLSLAQGKFYDKLPVGKNINYAKNIGAKYTTSFQEKQGQSYQAFIRQQNIKEIQFRNNLAQKSYYQVSNEIVTVVMNKQLGDKYSSEVKQENMFSTKYQAFLQKEKVVASNKQNFQQKNEKYYENQAKNQQQTYALDLGGKYQVQGKVSTGYSGMSYLDFLSKEKVKQIKLQTIISKPDYYKSEKTKLQTINYVKDIGSNYGIINQNSSPSTTVSVQSTLYQVFMEKQKMAKVKNVLKLNNEKYYDNPSSEGTISYVNSLGSSYKDLNNRKEDVMGVKLGQGYQIFMQAQKIKTILLEANLQKTAYYNNQTVLSQQKQFDTTLGASQSSFKNKDSQSFRDSIQFTKYQTFLQQEKVNQLKAGQASLQLQQNDYYKNTQLIQLVKYETNLGQKLGVVIIGENNSQFGIIQSTLYSSFLQKENITQINFHHSMANARFYEKLPSLSLTMYNKQIGLQYNEQQKLEKLGESYQSFLKEERTIQVELQVNLQRQIQQPVYVQSSKLILNKQLGQRYLLVNVPTSNQNVMVVNDNVKSSNYSDFIENEKIVIYKATVKYSNEKFYENRILVQQQVYQKDLGSKLQIDHSNNNLGQNYPDFLKENKSQSLNLFKPNIQKNYYVPVPQDKVIQLDKQIGNKYFYPSLNVTSQTKDTIQFTQYETFIGNVSLTKSKLDVLLTNSYYYGEKKQLDKSLLDKYIGSKYFIKQGYVYSTYMKEQNIQSVQLQLDLMDKVYYNVPMVQRQIIILESHLGSSYAERNVHSTKYEFFLQRQQIYDLKIPLQLSNQNYYNNAQQIQQLKYSNDIGVVYDWSSIKQQTPNQLGHQYQDYIQYQKVIQVDRTRDIQSKNYYLIRMQTPTEFKYNQSLGEVYPQEQQDFKSGLENKIQSTQYQVFLQKEKVVKSILTTPLTYDIFYEQKQQDLKLYLAKDLGTKFLSQPLSKIQNNNMLGQIYLDYISINRVKQEKQKTIAIQEYYNSKQQQIINIPMDKKLGLAYQQSQLLNLEQKDSIIQSTRYSIYMEKEKIKQINLNLTLNNEQYYGRGVQIKKQVYSTNVGLSYQTDLISKMSNFGMIMGTNYMDFLRGQNIQLIMVQLSIMGENYYLDQNQIEITKLNQTIGETYIFPKILQQNIRTIDESIKYTQYQVFIGKLNLPKNNSPKPFLIVPDNFYETQVNSFQPEYSKVIGVPYEHQRKNQKQQGQIYQDFLNHQNIISVKNFPLPSNFEYYKGLQYLETVPILDKQLGSDYFSSNDKLRIIQSLDYVEYIKEQQIGNLQNIGQFSNTEYYEKNQESPKQILNKGLGKQY